jgi:hypothetical protein
MSNKISNGITFEPSDKPIGYNYLSDKEKKYFKIMNAKSGVLYIYSPPGFAKSAITRNIAKKLGAQYFDIRLSMIDETDVGVFPMIDNIIINGETKKVLHHVVPDWAYLANEKLTIIHFEELNRSSNSVRNAALQILLEREIGTFFKFNNNVLMCASGNLGEDDDTDVEEFDAALNNRLIQIEHELPFTEWYENYANEFVCPTIVNFLKNHGDYYWKKSDNKSKNKAYATPRSWTFLSDYIWANFGENKYTTRYDNNDKLILDIDGSPKQFRKFPPPIVWLNDIKQIGHGFVGASNVRFFKYCEDVLKISIDNILNDYDSIENDIKSFSRDKKSELLQSMKDRKVSKLNKIQIKNLLKFFNTISADECVGYLLHVLDKEYVIDLNEKTNTIEDIERNKKIEKFLADPSLDKYRDVIFGYVNDDPAPFL